MTTLKVKDADGNNVWLNGEGAGTEADPFNPKQVVETIHRDQTTEDISHFLVQQLDTFTIDSNRSLDDYSFNITTTGTAPVAGNMACFKEGTKFLQAEILSVAAVSGNTYTITIDKYLNYAYTTAAVCQLGNKNLASGTSGATLASPIKFACTPEGMGSGVAWDICRMLITVVDTSAAVIDWGQFINIAALTNGLLLRVQDGDGRRETLGTYKKNIDFAADAYDADLFSYGGGAGDGALKVRATFNGDDKRGVVKRLEADANAAEFAMYVRDNITAIDELVVKIQGHFTD